MDVDGTKTPCFCYGSNSTNQLRERVGNPNIESFGCELPGFRRIFAGNSVKWGGGGVASIVPSEDSSCRGSFVWLSDDEFKKLDYFEGISADSDPFNADFSINRYRRCHVKISTLSGETIDAIAYIRNCTTWEGYPSDAYLTACYSNISAFWPRLDGDGYIDVYDETGEKKGQFRPG